MPASRLAAFVLTGALAFGAALPAAAGPRIDYMLECQGCHLPDGSGKPGVVPSLRGSVARFATLLDGRAYLVRVPGSALSPLSDARLAEVLNWMMDEFGPPESATSVRAFDADEVGLYRGEPLVDVAAVRAELLARLSSDRAIVPDAGPEASETRPLRQGD